MTQEGLVLHLQRMTSYWTVKRSPVVCTLYQMADDNIRKSAVCDESGGTLQIQEGVCYLSSLIDSPDDARMAHLKWTREKERGVRIPDKSVEPNF
ncbi:hypothetical protein ILYODFUR_003174 [Ilyodon furcidens]|uniref:Uncharacterized protein n=1 Tax=Ilyodon furcidens TaxID=33524 RepID=A0ABV0U6K9_9TELE